jgi:IS4 transposase
MAQQVIERLPGLPGMVYVLGDSWYSSQSIIRASRKRGFHYIGALKTNRVLYTPGGSNLGNKVKVYTKTLTENDVYLVTVGNQKYWVHRFNGFIKNLPKDGVIILSWPENKLFDEEALHVFYCTDNNLSLEQILKIYTGRWTIEIFFRQSKMQLELDRYQIRKKQAIKRFILLIMLIFAYCDSLSSGEISNLSYIRKSARMEIKREVVSWVYTQSHCGVPLSEINLELGICS